MEPIGPQGRLDCTEPLAHKATVVCRWIDVCVGSLSHFWSSEYCAIRRWRNHCLSSGRSPATYSSIHDAQTDYKLKCPGGYIPIGYSYQRQFASYLDEELKRSLIDRSNAVINRDSLSTAAQLDGAGYAVSILNTQHVAHDVAAMVTCLATATTTDSTLMLVTGKATVGARSVGTATSFCSPDFPVALGGFSNADVLDLQDAGSAPVWGTSSNPVLLADVADGQMGPPIGWQAKVFNSLASSAQIVSYGICGKVPPLQTYIYSVPTVKGTFASPAQFSIFAPIPDGWTAVGTGFDGGLYGSLTAMDAWLQDGTIIDMQPWFDSTRDSVYDSGAAQVARLHGVWNRHPQGQCGVHCAGKSGTRAVGCPAVRSPTCADERDDHRVLQRWPGPLLHYRVPGRDRQARQRYLRGWARTGQSFNAYAIGSTGRTGRRPVCRQYGRADVGLDSHFYSASPDECRSTLINTGGAWILEASEVFEMDLPDPLSGACPPGDVAVYRIWNQRRDSNHRYTTSIAIRDAMVQKGGVAEGYGPNAVALCALP
jgi:hypothetical protein